jgi:hypothetical protein
MTRERQPELPWDRHGPRGSVGLGRLTLPVTVDLPCELDLCVVEISDPHVRPGQAYQLGHASSGQSREREQCAVRLRCGRNRLLELAAFEDAAALRLRRLGPLRGQHHGHRIRAIPVQPPRSEPVDAIHDTESDHDRRLREASSA